MVASTRTSSAIVRRAAEALDLALLQHAQELRLQSLRHLRDLVEEQRSALRLLELAGVCVVRAGERAFLVPEEHGFEHLLRNRRAVDRDEWSFRARRMTVDVAREDFLAGAALAGEQHGDVARGDTARERRDAARARILRNEPASASSMASA